MARFKLATAVRLNLLLIYEFSRETFGEYQAEAYLAGLQRSFSLLAEFPKIGATVDDLAPRHRRYRFQSHYIFYIEEADHIAIRLILHVRQNPRLELFQ